MSTRAAAEAEGRRHRVDRDPQRLGRGVEQRARDFFPGINLKFSGHYTIGMTEVEVKRSPSRPDYGDWHTTAIATVNGAMHATISEYYGSGGYSKGSYFRVRGEDEKGNEIDAIDNKSPYGKHDVIVRKELVVLRPGPEKKAVVARLKIRTDIKPPEPVVVD